MYEQLDVDSSRNLIEREAWPDGFKQGDRVFIRSIEQTGVVVSVWSIGATVELDGSCHRFDIFRFDDMELRAPADDSRNSRKDSRNESFPPWMDAWDEPEEDRGIFARKVGSRLWGFCLALVALVAARNVLQHFGIWP